MIPSRPESATDALVRGLRLSVHLGFGALLAFGVTSLVGEQGADWLSLALAALLAGVYVAGTAVERTRALRAGYGRRPDIPASWWVSWLAAVVGLWGVLLLRSPAFAYCAFPLFFIVLHLLRPLAWGLAGVVVLLAWLVSAFWRAGQLGAGAVVGPTVGAAFSVVVFIIYEALVKDSLDQRRALAELAAARTELAAAQHAAGVTAERERFSAEIHDTLAQGLNAIVLTARAGLAPRAGDDAPRQALAAILGLASANLAEAREMVRGSAEQAPARPDAQLARELQAAIERVGVGELDLAIRDERAEPQRSRPLSPEAHRLLVLAASSLAANVVRHARASRAVVTLSQHDDEAGSPVLSLDVVDDGRGFDPSTTPPGFGLSSLRERLERLGGRLLVESSPGEGTAVNITLPLDPAEETP